jgi:hypothetical protein
VGGKIYNYAQVTDATHKFDVYVQGKAISDLMIDLPEDIKINQGIEVKNKSGQKIPSTVSINDRKVTIAFSEVINPGTSLSITMRGVRTPGYEETWHYPVSVKKVGIKEEIPLVPQGKSKKIKGKRKKDDFISFSAI